MSTLQPRSVLIAALGGEGGGVLADWIAECALRSGLPVQATSVPGVAQRTGATSYYIEYLETPAKDGHRPVFALTPVPGRVDVVLASELLEAGRCIERGFVDRSRTLLITARHRVLTTQEKLAMGDGRFDDARLLDAARQLSQQCLALDLRGIAERHRSVISAVLFGALAGSGRLPWTRATCEAVIRDGGIGVAPSLAAFAEAFDVAADGSSDATSDAVRAAGAASNETGCPALPPALQAVVDLGVQRLTDYQDAAYAERYRQRLAELQAAAGGDAGMLDALEEAARQLALWMSYEDIVRVADLKTRASRLARVREEAMAGPDDIVEIREHLRPGLEELAAIAPRRMGLALRARVKRGQPAGTTGRSLTLTTTSIHGFAMLRLLAALRRLRPISLRFGEEQAAIDEWLQAMGAALPHHAGFARALAELPRLRKGYSDTFERGRAAYERIFAARVAPLVARATSGSAFDDAAAQALAAALKAALSDPEHQALDRSLGQSRPREQPILFRPRPGRTPGG